LTKLQSVVEAASGDAAELLKSLGEIRVTLWEGSMSNAHTGSHFLTALTIGDVDERQKKVNIVSTMKTD